MLLFQNKAFRILYASDLIGVLGSTLFDLVSILYAATLPEPVLAVGLTSMITALPYAINFIIGYISDKVTNKYKAMYAIRLIQVGLYLVFGALTLLHPSFELFIIVLLINFVSDMIGTINGYLKLSVFRKVVDEDVFSSALSLQNGSTDAMRLLGKSGGAALIAFLMNNYFAFALINAAIFLVSFVLLFSNRKLMLTKVPSRPRGRQTIKQNWQEFVGETRENFRFLKTQQEIFRLVTTYALINFMSSGISVLFYMTLVEDSSFIIGSMAFTIALAEILEIIAFILGSFFQLPVYKKMPIKYNLLIEVLLFALSILNYLVFKQIYLLLAINVLIGYLTAISNPKSDTIVIMSIAEDQQNAVFSIFGTLVSLTVPLSASLVTALSSQLDLTWIWCLLLAIAGLALWDVLRMDKKLLESA